MATVTQPASSDDDALAPELPPLPETATPEEKDLHWFQNVYRGDRMPQLTVRAVLMGGLLGMLMSVSNLYTTLKVGWSFPVAITSCVISYLVWNAIRTIAAGRVSQMSILENNCMQSTASSAGYSTGATIATAFGALLLLDPQHRHQPWLVVGSFTLVTAVMGVFLAIPMKRQMINHEQLAFPSGIAAATTLRSLYSRGTEAVKKAYSLVIALVAGAVVGILNTAEDQFVALGRFFVFMRTRLIDVHLPELVPATGFAPIQGKPAVAFGFEPSVLLIGAGMIVGLRVTLSIFAASALLFWGSHRGWPVSMRPRPACRATCRRSRWSAAAPTSTRCGGRCGAGRRSWCSPASRRWRSSGGRSRARSRCSSAATSRVRPRPTSRPAWRRSRCRTHG